MNVKCPNEECIAHGACGHHGLNGTCLVRPSAGYHAEVLADSVSPAGHRLTTMLWTFPRFILAELNTHRQLSRNSASSRAIPVEKRIAAVRENPFIPESFGKNRKGMQAGEALEGELAEEARKDWLLAAEDAIFRAEKLASRGVHKQLANRLLEPFSWHTAVISATDWDNLFAQRCHPDAQPEFRKIAELARDVRDASVPTHRLNTWHLPLVGKQYGDDGECRVSGDMFWPQISAARCARVSYLTHDGKRDTRADTELYQRLVTSGHMSPLEHVARPMTTFELTLMGGNTYCGNFSGWVQLRKTIAGERVFGGGT